MNIEVARYDHPDALKLTEQLQQIYLDRYGSQDSTPVDPDQFAPPRGVFLLGYAEGAPVACGGWRARDASAEGFLEGDAEIKRMYVATDMRGRGFARRILAALEASARQAGRSRMVLETGTPQPEAVALYASSGYTDVPKFGIYRSEPSCICMGKPL
ncbi:acetyltransferase [Wenjunlia vitaminophila]|uniref:Acetyltransferase n=1 Tax=Wenjunlia vitaminophila TaxID=76728 RepID=A0A0T6LWK7_WENVI|nr:GNAT family N-acetyltransferase [Wenjunlia vitaminophila]KRV50494.1 acetyltransferase [Wenjunlia vitaminophila]